MLAHDSRSGGTLGPWDIFLDFIFAVITWLYSWCGDWGLAIILITILFRLVIYPITRKQFKSTYKMQKLQPKIKELQAKYKGDPQRMQQETQKIYQEAKINPLSGCLPMLLQMPIFIALYGVLGGLKGRVAEAVILGQDYITMFGQNLTELLTRFNPGGVIDYYELDPDGKIINDSVRLHDGAMSFYGLVPDLASTPAHIFETLGIVAAMPYVIMLLLFAFSLVVPMLLQRQSDKNMKIMMGVMSVFMLWIGWGAPAGVLLYWDITSYIGAGQQFVSRKMLEAKDQNEARETIDIAPVKVEVDRKERKARPKKKSS
jgi:YidC/Oxa1 family membrane protein insertase